MQSKTIPGLLYERYRKTPDGIAHYSLDANGKWQPHTWKEYYSDVSRLAKGLIEVGLTTGRNIGIMAPASRQWDVVQMAILFCGGVVVGLDPHDAPDNINNIAKRTDLRGLIVGDVILIKKLEDEILKNLKFVVSFENGTFQEIKDCSIRPLIEVIEDQSLDFAFHAEHITENNPATIIFTSGTTGTPKGIQYTHLQAITACKCILEAFADITEGSCLVCWLPLSNLYQRIINYCAIVVGAATYYVENPRKVMEYLPAINPHIFLGVPRFYEKLYSGIVESINKKSIVVRKLAHWALQSGSSYKKKLRENKPIGMLENIYYRLAELMILARLKLLMGSNLKFMISGSAPISKWLLEEFHGMGFLILEAYGISENIIPIAVNRPHSFKFGTVGKPLPGNEIKLDEDGELLVRGPGVFTGYYNEPSAEKPITADGFLATGDYAQFDTDGFLALTGRKSDIFKTSTGRRIAPVKIEALISRLPYVEHTVIFGAGRPFLVALLSLNLEKLRARVKQEKFDIGNETGGIPYEYHEIIQNDVVRAVAELQSYLHPAGLLLTSEPFTIDNSELTANLKIRRKHIAGKYKKKIETLYKELEQKKHAKSGDSSPDQEFVIHSL